MNVCSQYLLNYMIEKSRWDKDDWLSITSSIDLKSACSFTDPLLKQNIMSYFQERHPPFGHFFEIIARRYYVTCLLTLALFLSVRQKMQVIQPFFILS